MAKMRELKIVPDILCTAPQEIAQVIFPSGALVEIGRELPTTEVQEAPEVGWQAEENTFYAICMVDPDAPNRIDSIFKEWLHWLVVNIPGNNIDEGEILAEYMGANPPRGSGVHRYAIIVFKQVGQVNFSLEKKLNSSTTEGREKFSTKKFAKKYKFGEPVAGNVFMAQLE